MTPIAESDRLRELVDRVRALLPGRPLREVRMFGVVAVMVDDAMAVGVHKDGSLLVRVDPAEDAQLLESPDASRAQMRAGRSMGEGWIRVASGALHSDSTLRHWVEAAARCLDERERTRERPTPRA